MIRIKIFLSLFLSPITFPCFCNLQKLSHSLQIRFRNLQKLSHSLQTCFCNLQKLSHSLRIRFCNLQKH